MPNWILGDKFDSVYPHKGSIETLWENKWKFACQKSVYPFHDGKYEDFEPIFKKLIRENINDAYTDEYTLAFISTARSLEKRAADALDQGHHETASELYRRAAVVYRISRFPYVNPLDRNSIKRSALEQQKQVYLKAASFWTPKIEEVFVPHTHRAGKDGDSIPLFVRVPEHAGPGKPVPVVLLMTGLDGYRPDNSQRSHEIIRRGWATVICEIPGTADCPADPSDPESPDRLWSSVLDYIASRDELDETQVAVWGLSAGGFYAIRAACTHKERLVGAIAHGAGSHHYLGEEWLSRIDDHEYPFLLTPAMAQKFGYRSTDEFRKDAQKRFSLLENGILEKPSCRLLSLNGIDDGIVPIEDSIILFEHGSAKEARFFPGLSHMGYPDSLPVAYDWLESVLPFEGKE